MNCFYYAGAVARVSVAAPLVLAEVTPDGVGYRLAGDKLHDAVLRLGQFPAGTGADGDLPASHPHDAAP